MKTPANCPKCGSMWDDGSIVETFIKQRDAGVERWKDMSDEGIRSYVEFAYAPPHRWNRVIGIEYEGVYDGILHYQCPDCGQLFERDFTPVDDKDESIKKFLKKWK